MKISRNLYLLLIITIPVFIGILSNFTSESQAQSMENSRPWMFIYLGIFLPILAFMRSRTIGFTWKEFLKSLIPFYGLKYSFKRFLSK